MDDWVKAIFPEAIILLPLPRNKSQFLALIDYSLASRVIFSGRVILCATLWGLRLLADAAG
jgi:hypothetical protein